MGEYELGSLPVQKTFDLTTFHEGQLPLAQAEEHFQIYTTQS